MTTELLYTPFAESELPPAVARVAGSASPAPMKMMTARGISPLPPADLAVALFQIFATSEGELKSTVRATIAKLADPILNVALPAPLDPRVLDLFARCLLGNVAALGLILGNRGLADETACFLASASEGDILDRIAQDEQRLLRHPAIIAALYMNPKTRSSVAMRAVELAAHNQVVVDIPGFEDIVASLKGVEISEQDDAKFQEVVSGDQEAPSLDDSKLESISVEDMQKVQQQAEQQSAAQAERKMRLDQLPVPLQIRTATLGNASDREILIRSNIKVVSMAAIRSPALSVQEVVKFAGNRALSEDVIRYISNRKEWLQLHAVRVALVNNNKCPLGVAISLLKFLPPRDLKALSRSRNIPAPLVKAAQELVSKRDTK